MAMNPQYASVEAALMQMKVTELKEVCRQAHLVRGGKKNDLQNRILNVLATGERLPHDPL